MIPEERKTSRWVVTWPGGISEIVTANNIEFNKEYIVFETYADGNYQVVDYLYLPRENVRAVRPLK